jgi:hypothetical protein
MADLGTIAITSETNTASFKISQFKNAIKGVARPNYFDASLSGYTKVVGLKTGSLENIDDTFAFRCERAEFPGRTLATADDAVGGGPAMKLPYDVTYNDIQLSIICSEDMKERVFFENWIDRIVGRGYTQNAGLIAYYSDYALGVSLLVRQLDSDGKLLLAYELQDCYPIAVSPMNATWEETNTYQRFTVTMAYRYHVYVQGQAAKNK